MHRAMAFSTIIMNGIGVCVVVLFAFAVRGMPDFAARAGATYAGVLFLASFASERIRHHLLVDDPENSAACCETAMKVSRILMGAAWVAMIALLVYVALLVFG
jgi:hypothetical protein